MRILPVKLDFSSEAVKKSSHLSRPVSNPWLGRFDGCSLLELVQNLSVVFIRTSFSTERRRRPVKVFS